MSTTTPSQAFDEASIFDAVQEMCEDVAVTPTKEFHFSTGRSSCLHLVYPESELDALSARAVESFAGVEDVSVIDRLDYFARSSEESTRKVAKSFGAHTIVFTGQKP